MTALFLGINIFVVQVSTCSHFPHPLPDCTQAFFCFRVYLITRSLSLGLVSFALALARFGIHICQMVTVFSATSFAVVRTARFRWEVTSLLTVGAASDVLIAVSICYALLRMRSGFEPSDKLVDKLVAFTVGVVFSFARVLAGLTWYAGSGLLTSIIAVIECTTVRTRLCSPTISP